MKVVKGQVLVGRFEVPYRIYGEKPETIICISGAKQTMAAWRSFINYFSDQYSVVVFDLPGQGRAKVLRGEPAIGFDEQQQVLLEVIATTNRNGKVILAAASWGTIVSAAVAASHPDLVDKLILGSFGVKPNHEILNVIKTGKALFEQGRTTEIAPLMIGSFGQYIPEAQKRQIIEQFSVMSHEEFMSFYAHCMFIERSKDLEQLIDMSKIKAKTLIVNGEFDLILDHVQIEAVSQRIPDCSFQLIPEVGHFLHWERPELLANYRAFLSA